MDADLILKIIQMYGFPAAMCVWFMFRLEKKMDAIETTNHKQIVIMAVLVRILGDKKAMGAIPEELIEEVTGVTEIPIPQSLKTSKD